MPDDLHIPSMASAGRAPISTSYRPRPLSDPSTRWMAIAAAVLGGTLLLGVGGWALMGRKPAAVPVIEADGRPLRVKPDNAGGMQIVGADEQVLGGGGAASGSERMAPGPEAPAPQALRAQMGQTSPAPVATPPGVSPLPDTPLRQAQAPRPTPPVPSTASAPPSAVASNAAVPPAPAATAPAPTVAAAPVPANAPTAAPAAPAARSTGTGSTMVQLAAVDSQTAAQGEWQRLAKRMPDLLGDRRLVTQKTEHDGKTMWRVRTGGFADVAEATGFCAKVRAKGGNCALASF